MAVLQKISMHFLQLISFNQPNNRRSRQLALIAILVLVISACNGVDAPDAPEAPAPATADAASDGATEDNSTDEASADDAASDGAGDADSTDASAAASPEGDGAAANADEEEALPTFTFAGVVPEGVEDMSGALFQPFSPLPIPAFGVEIPEAEADSGIVFGRIQGTRPSHSILMAGELYLAPLISGEKVNADDPDVRFISLQPGADKQADIRNEGGDFAFFNVPPGEYAIVVYTPVEWHVPADSTGSDLFINVEAGETIDLGLLLMQ